MSTSILVFDGVCVLCSRWVQFVLRHDRQRRYRFTAMQSAAGRELLLSHGLDPNDPVSFLLLEQDRAYTDTEAIARVLSSFESGWTLAAMLIRIVPRSVRDRAYRWLARNRYRLFGRRDACPVPSAELADRFLE